MKKTSQGVPLPLIHLNGSSRESLQEGYREALRQARQLRLALRQQLVHARDYYPLGPGAYTEAAEVLDNHLDAIRRLERHIEEHLEHLAAPVEAAR